VYFGNIFCVPYNGFEAQAVFDIKIAEHKLSRSMSFPFPSFIENNVRRDYHST
jgi:hypothetical protein